MNTQIYWIRHPEHNDMFNQGYIGVSKHLKYRLNAHAQTTENPHLRNAINKYGWNNLIKEIILISDDAYCYNVENKLRPNESIGWNINIGGTKPPRSKHRGADYVSPLKGKKRETPWLFGRTVSEKERELARQRCLGKKYVLGKKQTPEHAAKRAASRKATLEAQGRTR